MVWGMPFPPPGPGADQPGPALLSPTGAGAGARALLAADELSSLAPDLGWSEVSSLAQGVLDLLAHRLVDLADDRSEPTAVPPVVGAVGGPDRSLDHASCRAVAARLRGHAPLLLGSDHGWARESGAAMLDLADLLDGAADRFRARALTRADKSVVVRRLHAVQRRLRLP